MFWNMHFISRELSINKPKGAYSLWYLFSFVIPFMYPIEPFLFNSPWLPDLYLLPTLSLILLGVFLGLFWLDLKFNIFNAILTWLSITMELTSDDFSPKTQIWKLTPYPLMLIILYLLVFVLTLICFCRIGELNPSISLLILVVTCFFRLNQSIVGFNIG